MTQIDLISNEWSDLLFENRNKEYGAYVLRHQTSTRNIMSIIAVLILFAIVMAVMVAKNAYDDYKASHIRHEDVVILTNLPNQKPEPKVERAEPVRQEKIEEVVENVRKSIKFTAPVIKKDITTPLVAAILMQKTNESSTKTVKDGVPLWEKYTLTIREAAEYFHIGENRMRRIVEENPYADYIIMNGNRVMIKRKVFEKYIDESSTI